jgi:hypothetical protein
MPSNECLDMEPEVQIYRLAAALGTLAPTDDARYPRE